MSVNRANRERGAMLPVWGAYVVACIALGACAYQAWIEPVSAKMRLEAAKLEYDKEQMAYETAKRYERMSMNMGYNRVKPGVGE